MKWELTGFREGSLPNPCCLCSRRYPVAEVVPFRHAHADADVGLQDVVLSLRVGEGQPLPDHRIVGFQNPLVAVIQVNLPGHGDHEAAPHRTAAALVRVIGGGVRQVAGLGILRIAPIGGPAVVEAPGVKVEQARFERGSGVAAVAQAFARGAVHHVAVEREALVGPGHQIGRCGSTGRRTTRIRRCARSWCA